MWYIGNVYEKIDNVTVLGLWNAFKSEEELLWHIYQAMCQTVLKNLWGKSSDREFLSLW